MFGKEKIPQIQADIERIQAQLNEAETQAASLFRYGEKNAKKLDDYYDPIFQADLQEIRTQLAQSPTVWVAGWDEQDQWNDWQAQDALESPYIRIGMLREHRQQQHDLIPGFIPFIGQNRTVIIQSEGDNADLGLQLLQSLVVRTALLMPHQARYTLTDPAGAGRAFPMRRYLPQVRENSGDVRRDLEGVIVDIQRIIETYLDTQTSSFDQVPHLIRLNEPYQFVFAADFPKNYDRRAIEALQAIGNTGGIAGVYLFIHYNRDHELPRDVNLDSFENAHFVTLHGQKTETPGLHLHLDLAPAPDLQLRFFETLQASKPPERVIKWQEMEQIATDPEQWWQADATESVEAIVGVHGSNNPLKIWYGQQDGRPCAHGMLGAMTGSGKSNLYHVLIAGLATRYGPDELRLYLIDGKDGVEFQSYRHLPHTEVVSLRSSPELSRSVLAELIEEKERRNDLFTQAGARDYVEYRRKTSATLPRILLLVDEYQELFDGDRDGIASAQLLQLAQQGRSAGIHMFLGSQHFGAVGMLNRQQIFDNFHLRSAMQMANDAVQSLTEFGRKGKGLISSTCDLPGKIVINDRSGDDSGNFAGKVAFLDSELRDEVIDALQKKTDHYDGDLPARIIFDGKRQPLLLDNPQFIHLLNQGKWLTPEEMESLARKPYWDDGFNEMGWYAGETPRISWMGQDFSVRGQAQLILRRRIGENVMVVGDANAERYGMLIGMLSSLALNISSHGSRFVIFDGSIPGTPWAETLSSVNDLVLESAGFDTRFTRDRSDLETMIADLCQEIERRLALDHLGQGRLPDIYFVATELDRIDGLRRQLGSYGMAVESQLGEQFARVYVEGPPLGIHLILSFAGVNAMSSVVDVRSGLDYFRHRVATQMSEDASHNFVRSRNASRLQEEGQSPVCAYYFNVESDLGLRFKPYTTQEQFGEFRLTDVLRQIGTKLEIRGDNS